MNRTDQLIKIMHDNNLSAADVGALLNRSATTVRIWRSRGERKCKTIPEHALKLLESKYEVTV